MSYALKEVSTDSGNPLAVSLEGKISDGNSTSANLAGGASFIGASEDTLNYASVIISIHTDQDSAVDGLKVEWSVDNLHWDVSDVFSIFEDEFKIFTFMPVSRYFRLSYVNGPNPTTLFHLQTSLKQTSVKPSSHRVEETISSEDDAELVKAVLTGATPFGDYDTVKMDSTGSLNVAFGDSANLDAFSRLRVSNPDTVFDSTFQYDLQPLVFQQVTTGGATITHSPNDSSGILALTGGTPGRALLQSKAYHRYLPGKGQLVFCTGVLGAATAGVVKRVGYFDDSDGVFYEQNGTSGLRMVVRTSVSGAPVDIAVDQADWNLDTLDGLGRSGITLDPSKCYILVIEMQWLGMGRVRVGFDIDGRIYPVHEFLHANIEQSVYMKTANLPIRWEIVGDAVSDTCQATCCSVQSEGGADRFLAYKFSYDRASLTAGSGARTYAFSIRPKATFNGVTNRTLLRPVSFGALVTGNSPVLVEIFYGTTVGGTPAWTDMNATYSALQVDTAGTPAGGVKVASFYVPSSNQSKGEVNRLIVARYPLALDYAGTGFSHYTVYVTGVGGDSLCWPGVEWEEVR